MPYLYLMRHGQTEFNLQKRVQGHCDSPLTELGRHQARVAADWLAQQGVTFDRMCTSPLGRARDTLSIVRDELAGFGAALPAFEVVDGLIERSYGSFESGLQADVPTSLWDPDDLLVAYGAESRAAARARIVDALTGIMLAPSAQTVLAVAHGAIILQFKQAWEQRARCLQDVYLDNCCVLRFAFDPAERTFACEQIRLHDFDAL